MNQKGFAPILIVLILAALVGGYLIYQNQTKPTPQPIQPSHPTQSSPIPTQTITNIVHLSNAWKLGTKSFSDAKIHIIFNYPSYFTVNIVDIEKANKEWVEKYKNNPDVRQPLYRSSFSAGFYTQEISSGNDADGYREICDNKMSVGVHKYDNPQNLPLYDFIADLNKSYPGDGITATFDTYEKTLTKTQIPKPESYIFEGIILENPVKEVYFTHKNNVYEFSLIGNCDTGGRYTKDAEEVFENILQSVKFK